MSSAPKAFPRSPAGLLSGDHTDEPISRSSSAISSVSASPMAHPGILRRESTSGGLDYYWSSLAGVGPNSSSSSLAISPSPSTAGLTYSLALPPTLPASGSSPSGLAVKQPMSDHPLPPTLSTDHLHPHMRPNGGGPLRVVDLSENGTPTEELELESPSGWSGDSDYSNEGSGSDSAQIPHSHSRYNGLRADSFGSSNGQSGHSPIDYQALLGPGAPSLPRSTGDVRGSVTSTTSESTCQPHQEDAEDDDPMDKTPVAPPFIDAQDRAQLNGVGGLNFDRSPRRDYPRANMTSPTKQTTPTRPIASPSARGYTPTSGRIPFTAPLEVHKKSSSGHGEMRVDITVPSPRSAPAWKSEFGDILPPPISDPETIRVKGKRLTLPASGSTSSAAIVDALLSPEKNMLSPDKYARAGSISPEKRSRDASPARSPEPPPRSTLRTLYSPRSSADHSPFNLSPHVSATDLPTIINTPHSPVKTPERPQEPPRPTRSPSRTPSVSTEETINDLTDMLGGAIAAIDLGNTDDDAKHSVPLPKREKPNLALGSLAPSAEVENGPITPTSLPNRGASLSDSAAMPPPPLPRPVERVRRVPSGISLRSAHHAPPPVVQSPTTIAAVSQRPWPASMLYGNIKGMKYAGDRAKAYAKSINDLARAETGLREWCSASASSSSRPPVHNKGSSLASLGLRPGQPSTSTLVVPPSSHMRNVSSGSEFPMRADSYTAREISQRAVDPSDAPNSLPPNLPYPQLQAQYSSGLSAGGGGMKPSQSMQSISSFSSKRSFFGGIGKKSSSKKESTSLGPPSSVNKKDVRGLPISSPAYTARTTSPHRSSDGPGVVARSAAGMSAPMGPRGPRLGSFTPPPTSATSTGMVDIPARASLDTGLSRLNTGTVPPASRGSLDGLRPVSGSIVRKGSLPPKGASLAEHEPGGPSEEEVRGMGDILPHVSRGVIKAYLTRYGDQMQAIGMYLEDEKRGKVIRG